MVNGIIEYRDFKIIMERTPAIITIKQIAPKFSKYPDCGLMQAKEIYEELSEIVKIGQYSFNNSSPWSEQNYSIFLKMLKNGKVISFNEYDDEKVKEEIC